MGEKKKDIGSEAPSIDHDNDQDKNESQSGDWVDTLDKAAKEVLPPEINDLYPVDLTDQERAAGFEESIIPNPNDFAFSAKDMKAMIRPLGGGKRAVKMRNSITGQITYAIWDWEQAKPVDRAVNSLEELLQKYPPIS